MLILSIFQLNAEIAEFEELREKELPQVKEVNSKVEELNQTVAGLNKHQLNLRSSHKRLIEKVNEMDEKVQHWAYLFSLFTQNFL